MKARHLTGLALASLLVATWARGVSGHLITMTPQESFSPRNATVAPGDKVTWQNRDKDNHTVTSDTGVAGLNSDKSYPKGLAPGDRFTWTVPKDANQGQRFYYHCRLSGEVGDGKSPGTGMSAVITIK